MSVSFPKVISLGVSDPLTEFQKVSKGWGGGLNSPFMINSNETFISMGAKVGDDRQHLLECEQ